MIFMKRREERVGLDIGDAYVKAVQLAEREGAYELTGFGISRIEGPDMKAKTDAIKSAALAAGVSAKKVNTAVSGQSVIVRYITLPKMSKSELVRAARFEAEKYLPFDINEIVLDPHILEQEATGTRMRVLLVAAKKKIIEEHIKLVKDAGFSTNLIDIDSFSLVNSFELANPAVEGTVALLNIGSKFTNVNILKNYVSYFMRDIGVGGTELRKALSDKLGISAEEADGLIKNPAARQEEANKVILPVFNNLLGEISLSFDYYENQLEQSVEKVYLSGGAAFNMGLDKFLSSNLAIPVICWSCVDKMKLGKQVDKEKLSNMAGTLAVAIGLALAPRKD